MATNTAVEHGYDASSFAADGIRHDVYRAGSGPAVIVMHELPGLVPAVVAVAERIRSEGFTVIVPDLLPAILGRRSVVLNFPRICVVREFRAFALRSDRPVTRWLQALAAAEHARVGGPGVGIVGMCFSGGFALAAATRAPIVVAIASQPSLPLRWRPGAPRDLGMPAAAEQALAGRSARGEVCVRAFRYQDDPVSPPERMARLKELLGDDVVVEPIRGKDHPVLDRAVGMGRDGPGAPDPNAVPALTETLRVLRVGLLGERSPAGDASA
jgi:dienelactone hydrolase